MLRLPENETGLKRAGGDGIIRPQVNVKPLYV
jgi:hypothetical protein